MEDMRLKIWSKLEYKEPELLLRALAPLLEALAKSSLSEKFKKFRKSKQKTQRETLHAAVFTRALALALQIPEIEFAMIEDQDYDCVIRHHKDGTVHYTPVQLKELVPESLPGVAVKQPHIGLEAEIRKLEKYTDSKDLVVAFFVNRAGHYGAIKVPKLPLAGLWLYGAAAPDSSSWLVVGDLLSDSAAVSKVRLLS